MRSFPFIFIPLDIPTMIPRIPTLIPRIFIMIPPSPHYDPPIPTHHSPHFIPRFPIPAFTASNNRYYFKHNDKNLMAQEIQKK